MKPADGVLFDRVIFSPKNDLYLSIHPREYIFPTFKMSIDVKSSLVITFIDGKGELDIGKFTQVSWSGAVIASDSVVVKSIPPYTIWGGNPARFIKNRFEPRVSEKLQRIRWWDWDIEKIHDNYKYFDEPEQFAEMFDIQ